MFNYYISQKDSIWKQSYVVGYYTEPLKVPTEGKTKEPFRLLDEPF